MNKQIYCGVMTCYFDDLQFYNMTKPDICETARIIGQHPEKLNIENINKLIQEFNSLYPTMKGYNKYIIQEAAERLETYKKEKEKEKQNIKQNEQQTQRKQNEQQTQRKQEEQQQRKQEQKQTQRKQEKQQQRKQEQQTQRNEQQKRKQQEEKYDNHKRNFKPYKPFIKEQPRQPQNRTYNKRKPFRQEKIYENPYESRVPVIYTSNKYSDLLNDDSDIEL